MDVSGGNGHPQPGNDRPTEHPATPTTPAPEPPGPRPHDAHQEPHHNGTAPAENTTNPSSDEPAETAPTSVDEPVGEPSGEPSQDAEPGETVLGRDDAETEGRTTGPMSARLSEEAHGHAAAPPEAEPDAADAPTSSDAVHVTAVDAASHSGNGEPDDAVPHTPTPSTPEPSAPTPTPTPPHHARSHADSGTAKGRPPQRAKEPGGGLLMGRPFGVPVYVAPSWFLVAALITWVFGGQLDRVLPELGAARYLVSLFFAVAFYASVLIHELAHTVAAIRYQLPVRRIQLQFFGGVSEIEKEAETPGREFMLAFVGPLLSLVLAGLFYLAMQPVRPGTVPGVLLAGLMVSNLIVAAFNLLPGLPLDGGRMLRAVVWKITGRPMSGTVAAAWVGRALAITVLIGLPLLNQSGVLGSGSEDISGMDTVTDALLAAILAAIIWTGAGNSLRMARLREHLPELRARTLTRRAVPVESDTPLSEALRRANAAGARALVVVDADGNPRSLVREAAIVGVPEHRRPWVAVSGLAQELTDGMCVSAELAGEDLLDVLRATPATEYLVVEETGEIYGVLSAADVERAFVNAMARPNP
ncbi:site-2 protease family protein [Streptomyces sp. NPDC002619]|uniref:site-2 protease family protein n=1 Tax=Streptomyces sp. NPDC002619 TaxID=3364655 RepID=UPI0036B9C19A